MHKVVPSTGWNLVPGDALGVLVKWSSRGLVGSDRRLLTKRANDEFVELARKIQVAPGEELVHIIAMGATERYGPNRNGDGFKEATLKKHHPTFVKYARVYRNHQNRDPAKSYGVIKLSYYNPEMKRVELLLALNGTEEAAKRNGGLVADKELQKLASGQDLAGSMSCTVPYDVCSSCNNKARSRAEYCDEDTCIGPHGEKRGGCKRHLGKVAYDGHWLHVDNPTPRFFDYSIVGIPADRIAYGVRADYLAKAASDAIIGGAELAEMLCKEAHRYEPPLLAPSDRLEAIAYGQAVNSWQKEAISWIRFLADRDSPEHLENRLLFGALRKVAWQQQPPCMASADSEASIAMREFGHNQVCLSLPAFMQWLGCSAEQAIKAAQAVEPYLPGVYRKLAELRDGQLAALLAESPFQPIHDTGIGHAGSVRWRKWADMHRDCFGASAADVQRRIYASLLRVAPGCSFDKAAAARCFHTVLERTNAAADALARQYAMYKAAVLVEMASQHQKISPLTWKIVLADNWRKDLN